MARTGASIYPFVYLPTYLPMYACIYVYIHLSIHPSIHLSIYLYLSIYLSLSICLSVCLSVSLYLPAYGTNNLSPCFIITRKDTNPTTYVQPKPEHQPQLYNLRKHPSSASGMRKQFGQTLSS